MSRAAGVWCCNQQLLYKVFNKQCLISKFNFKSLVASQMMHYTLKYTLCTYALCSVWIPQGFVIQHQNLIALPLLHYVIKNGTECPTFHDSFFSVIYLSASSGYLKCTFQCERTNLTIKNINWSTRTRFGIELLSIIPCIIYYVTNKETLNLVFHNALETLIWLSFNPI